MGATFIHIQELWYIGRDRRGAYYVQVLLQQPVWMLFRVYAALELKRHNLLLCGRRVNTSSERLICPSVNCNQWNNKLKYTNILHSIVLLCVILSHFFFLFFLFVSGWCFVFFFFFFRSPTCHVDKIYMHRTTSSTIGYGGDRKIFYKCETQHSIVKRRDQSEVWRIIYCSEIREATTKKKMNEDNNCLKWCY